MIKSIQYTAMFTYKSRADKSGQQHSKYVDTASLGEINKTWAEILDDKDTYQQKSEYIRRIITEEFPWDEENDE